MNNSFTVYEAKTQKQYHQASLLCREYANELGIDLSFQNFEEELDSLPGMYAPPGGAFFLAQRNDQNSVLGGCAAVRPLPAVGEDACEMKRMYVRPAYRRQGLGRALSLRVLKKARELGYGCIYLDTLVRLQKAISLYESVGFSRVAKYYDNPHPDTCYLAMKL